MFLGKARIEYYLVTEEPSPTYRLDYIRNIDEELLIYFTPMGDAHKPLPGLYIIKKWVER